MRPALVLAIGLALLLPQTGLGQETPAPAAAPATRPAVKFPAIEIHVKARRVRVDCEALDVKTPLEFFLCASGSSEHESVLRSPVKPSHLHAALLMIGLTAGEPVRYSEAAQKWLPPQGPPLAIHCVFEKNGQPQLVPAYRLMRDIRSKREMPPTTWIFTGSRLMDGGAYAADRTGYLISVVNFDLTVIDIPRLASNANEALEWEINSDAMPPAGTKITLVIEPAGKEGAPATQAADGAASAEVDAPPAARGPIDQPLVTISAAGEIRLDDVPVASPDELLAQLRKNDRAQRRVRVAIANPIEANPQARDVMNALSRAGVKFLAIPQAQAGATQRPADVSAGVRADDEAIARLRDRWEQSVAPQAAAVRTAAKTHYDVIQQLRREQQRLIDEADKVQRLIDQLEKRYQDMATPAPAE